MTGLHTIKPKRCKACGELFTPARPLARACSLACAIILASKSRIKAEAKEHREAKRKAKPRAAWMKEAQAAANAYVRVRDAHLPCISCGTTADVQYAAGHYRTVGAAGHLRYHPDNLHKQCNRHCNMARSGNLLAYRVGLIEKIGQPMVEYLESSNTPYRWTVEDLIAVKQHYTEAKKHLENMRKLQVEDGSH